MPLSSNAKYNSRHPDCNINDPRFQLVDLASEQMLHPAPLELEDDRDHLDEAALVAHVDELIAAQQHVEVESAKAQKRAVSGRQRQSTSLLNPSTVWFGNTPIVYREDLATPSFYTFCRCHQAGGRFCRKDIQINRPDKDTVIRVLATLSKVFFVFFR